MRVAIVEKQQLIGGVCLHTGTMPSKASVPFVRGVARFRDVARGEIIGDASGMLKLLFHRETRRLLGAHVIGTQATELIRVGTTVMALGGTLDYFTGAVFTYPTLSECYEIAAFDAEMSL